MNRNVWNIIGTMRTAIIWLEIRLYIVPVTLKNPWTGGRIEGDRHLSPCVRWFEPTPVV